MWHRLQPTLTKACWPRVTEAAAAEDIAAGAGLRSRRQPHERREVHDIGGKVRRRAIAKPSVDKIGRILGKLVELATRGIVALVTEEFIGDALLDIVGLTREHQQRLILRLPAEPGDGAIVGTVIEVPGNAVGLALAREGCCIVFEVDIGRVLDLPGSEGRRRDAEDNVSLRHRLRKIRLGYRTTRRIGASGDDKQIMHPTVRCTVGVVDEPRLAHRPVHRDEGWHAVLRAIQRRHCHFRIRRWTGAADCRLGVAAGATIQIKPRAQAGTVDRARRRVVDRSRHRVDLSEPGQRRGEQA